MSMISRGLVVDMTLDARGTNDMPVLTGREFQVLSFVAFGLSNKEVAIELGIAPRTVERHVENVRNKIRARNRAHMVAKAIAFGVLSSPLNAVA